MLDSIDKRPKVAIYSTCGSKRDRRAVELLGAFCAINNLHGVFFLDKRIGKTEHPPAWDKLCGEVSKGKFQAVLTWVDLDVEEMDRWCGQFGATFQKVDIFDWFQSMRAAKVDATTTINIQER